MPKWKLDETNFTVTLFYDVRRGCMATIPKPIVEKLGSPNKMTFVVKGRKIEVAGEK